MSFLTTIFAPGEQERSDELDRRRIELERRRAERGLISEQQAADNIARIEGQRLDVEGEVGAAFNEGLKEGYDNVTGGISSTLKAPFKFVWDSVPFVVWLALAAGIFVWMGGLSLLKGRFSK